MRANQRQTFSAAFECPQCGRVIEFTTYQAVIDTYGLEIGCIGCKTLFLVTNQGATPITDDDLRQLTTDVPVQTKEGFYDE